MVLDAKRWMNAESISSGAPKTTNFSKGEFLISVRSILKDTITRITSPQPTTANDLLAEPINRIMRGTAGSIMTGALKTVKAAKARRIPPKASAIRAG